ncbi:hypothetical protein V8C26DRAFT_398837 [Trichoderma gracile]
MLDPVPREWISTETRLTILRALLSPRPMCTWMAQPCTMRASQSTHNSALSLCPFPPSLCRFKVALYDGSGW